MASPLGRYSEPAALGVSLALVVVWLLVQVGVFAPANGGALDSAAALAIGIVLGQRATTNGAAKIAAAAHKRLDAIGAPPAEDGAPPAG